MKYLICFLLGLVAGVAGHWYFGQSTAKQTVAQGTAEAHEVASNVGQALRDTFAGDRIRDELARTGKVIREKARVAGDAVGEVAANARMTGTVKSKLVQDAGLAAFKIDVDTTDGVVTLSGTVPSHEAIEKAMDLALETEGVYKVISTLQVKP